MRFTFEGKRREMGPGSFPDVGLADARDKAARYRRQAKRGTDPIEARRAAPNAPTFTTCASRYIWAHRHGWTSRKHARQWVSTLKTYARPLLGSKRVDVITTEDILKVLSPLWTDKTETAKRVRTRLENILDYAAAYQYRDPLNPARCRGHLDKLLPKPSQVKPVSHYPAMPYTEVPGFMAELFDDGSVPALALLLLMRSLGYGVNGDRGDYVPHGFRASFRDWSGEVSSFPRDVAEMALAHGIENKVEAAYRRGDLFAKRRQMMQAWAAYVNRGS